MARRVVPRARARFHAGSRAALEEDQSAAGQVVRHVTRLPNRLLPRLHLHTGEDERAYSFRIVVADFLRDVVLVRAVAITLFFGIAAEADYLDGAVDGDQA